MPIPPYVQFLKSHSGPLDESESLTPITCSPMLVIQ